MKVILSDNNSFVLRFDKGEEVLAGLISFLKDQEIKAGHFSGIGAASEADLAFYNPFVKAYRTKPYVEELEIVSLTGNCAVKNGEPAVHAHGVFGRNDFTTLSAHVNKLTVAVTCEIFLTKLDGEINRAPNADFNLDLMV